MEIEELIQKYEKEIACLKNDINEKQHYTFGITSGQILAISSIINDLKQLSCKPTPGAIAHVLCESNEYCSGQILLCSHTERDYCPKQKHKI